LTPEQREKEDSARVTRQRPIIRVSSELALVGIIKDAPDRSGAEWVMKALKELVNQITANLMSILLIFSNLALQ
jgi:regulator of nonsense transcripts 2